MFTIFAWSLLTLICLSGSIYTITGPDLPRNIKLHPKNIAAWRDLARETQDSSSATFRAIHAHAYNPSSNKILLHNATSKTAPGVLHPFFDVTASDLDREEAISMAAMPTLTLRTRRTALARPRHPIRYLNNTRAERIAFNAAIEWEDDEVEVPDITDRETLRTLAKMASNAYITPESIEWWGLDDYNHTTPFGWEKDADGLRGHVFANDDNSTVIISIKGTSSGLLGGGGNTAKNDKFNDNLLFSCCCARVDFSWSTVCDCYAGGYKCEKTCLENAVIGESVYTTVGTNLYNNISRLYPDSNIWLVGHSLGGSLASLIGLSFGAPVVAFEAPGEKMAAKRLHLPLPPGMPAKKMGITHVYNNADPIPMGECVGAYSGCYATGYAMESRCHVGETILYDTVGKKGWASDIRAHRIGEVINRILNEDWEEPPEDDIEDRIESYLPAILSGSESMLSNLAWVWPRFPSRRKEPEPEVPEEEKDKPKKKNPNAVPKAEPEDQCVDCFRWEFGDGMKKEPPTTTILTSASIATGTSV